LLDLIPKVESAGEIRDFATTLAAKPTTVQRRDLTRLGSSRN
jgi:hypothetical protein